MSHILRTSTEHKTASLADEGNSAYCQSAYKYKTKTNNKKNEYVLIKTNGTILLYKSDILNVYFTQSTITFKSMPVFNLRFEFI